MKNNKPKIDTQQTESRQELIGVLTAISIVAKRLANRLAAIENQVNTITEKCESGKESRV